MYKTGHIGISLLLYAPVWGALLFLGSPDLAVIGAAIVLIVADLPDKDLKFKGLIPHRGPTHTIWFGLLVGFITGGLCMFIPSNTLTVSTDIAVIFGFFAGFAGIMFHLAGDIITPAGITPLWPIHRSNSISLNFTKAANPVWNALFLILGVFSITGITTLLMEFGLITSLLG